ncbi:glycosyltransferase [Limosilactobacillus reuteri subsp. suis]|uniref:glycosyltransferase n=1 Tax=Limosilactobacillus reuteri TaxID=1598 RepID=UPI00399575A9
MIKDKKILVVIITYNRCKTLKLTLDAISHQSVPVNGILVFDNNSNDSTISFLKNSNFLKKSQIKENELIINYEKTGVKYYYRNDSNIGGAGGFSRAIKIAQKLDYDYLWLMDDDVIPEKQCLEKLKNAIENNNVDVAIPNRSDDNFKDRAVIDFDLESVQKCFTGQRKKSFYGPFGKKYYFVKDMPFEGPLMKMELSRKVGLPNPGYFIEYDDSDYAQRIQRFSKIIFVANTVLHRQLAKPGDQNKKMGPYNWRTYYTIRNNMVFDRKYGTSWGARNLSPTLLMAHLVVLAYRRGHLKNNLPIILKAWHDALFNKMGKRVSPDY